MTATEYRQALDVLPFGKRLPGAVYLLDPGDDLRIPSVLRIMVAELRKRLEINADFNLLKFHTASPKISFLAYPDFEKNPHPALAESIIVDLVTGKARRDDYRSRANPPILHHSRRALLVSTLIAGQEAYDDIRTFGDGVLTSRDTFQKFFDPAEIHALLEDTLHTEAVPVGLGMAASHR